MTNQRIRYFSGIIWKVESICLQLEYVDSGFIEE